MLKKWSAFLLFFILSISIVSADNPRLVVSGKFGFSTLIYSGRSPHGKYLIASLTDEKNTRTNEQIIRNKIFDLKGRFFLRNIPIQEAINSCLFSDDDKYAYISTERDFYKVDILAGSILYSKKNSSGQIARVIAPVSKILYYLDDSAYLHKCDLQSGKDIYKTAFEDYHNYHGTNGGIETGLCQDMKITQDEHTIYLAHSNGAVFQINTLTGTKEKILDSLDVLSFRVIRLSLSQDGKYLSIEQRGEKKVIIYNTRNHKSVNIYLSFIPFECIFTSNNHVLIPNFDHEYFTGGAVYIYDCTTGISIKNIRNDDRSRDITVKADKKNIYINYSSQSKKDEMLIVDQKTNKEIPVTASLLLHRSYLDGDQQNGNSMISHLTYDTLIAQIIDLKNDKIIASDSLFIGGPHAFSNVSINTTGTTLLLENATTSITDIKTGEKVASVPYGSIECSDDGRKMLIGTMYYDVETNRQIELPEMPEYVDKLMINKDGSLAVALYMKRDIKELDKSTYNIRVWELSKNKNGPVIRTLNDYKAAAFHNRDSLEKGAQTNMTIEKIQFTQDGRYLFISGMASAYPSYGSYRIIKIINIRTGKTKYEFLGEDMNAYEFPRVMPGNKNYYYQYDDKKIVVIDSTTLENKGILEINNTGYNGLRATIYPGNKILAINEPYKAPLDTSLYQMYEVKPDSIGFKKLSLGNIDSAKASFGEKYEIRTAADNEMMLYNLKKSRELLRFYSTDGSNWVITAPDGRFEASEGALPYLYYIVSDKQVPLATYKDKYFTKGLLAKVLQEN